MIRSVLDIVNHVILYVCNKISFGDYYNIKKYIVFMPAIFFVGSGFHTLSSAYSTFYYPVHEAPVAFSWIPIAVGL